MIKDKIINRIYIKGNLLLISPLILGCGEDENSDIDLIRDWEGNTFIPASSIAGAIRNYMDSILEKDQPDRKKENEIIRSFFGEREKESHISLITFYDSFPVNNLNIKLRDGVELNKIKRIAENKRKFEYEIIEPDAIFDFKCEITIREEHKEKKEQIDRINHTIYLILNALENGKIRFGAKTRRGFGELKLENCQILLLDMMKKDDTAKWFNFSWENSGNKKIEDFKNNSLSVNNELTKIEANFHIPYSILIRHYSANPKDPDSVHLTCNENSIIPGPSWAGLLRHTIFNIGRTINKENKVKRIVKEMFGFVDETEKDYLKKGKASRVILNESIIKNGIIIPYTRNKVDRFTGGVVDSALFDEAPLYKGDLVLNIEIKDSKDYETGLILLALKDIGNGISPVGGGVNIGRGILELKGIKINGNPFELDKNSEKYFKELAVELSEGSEKSVT